VSNFDHAPTVYALLQRERLVSYFDAVVVSGELGWRKPHRLIFDTALQGLGVSAEQALFVGDNFELDVVGAARAGIAAVWYTRGRTVQPPSDRPDYPVVTDLANLMRLG
jgi:putative hydrolase of the HAD superfamily